MALKGLRVVEMAGLAPAPFCGMILSDYGASVIRVDKPNSADIDTLSRGKKSISIDMKRPEGVNVIRKLCAKSDVLIEPFRKGVMEKNGLGPDNLLRDNPRLIYARLTGFGQSGPYSSMAGHDINYIALSGLLNCFGRYGEKPSFPVNLMADFAGGGLTCALGILMALLERERSGKGQIVDASMVEGASYVGSFLWTSRNLPFWGKERGKNILDGGSYFYDTYETKDGKYVAVGALEPQFYNKLIEGLKIDLEQFSDNDESKAKLAAIFKERTRDEWCKVFDGTDACVAPVLSLDEAPLHPHNKERNSFVRNEKTGDYEPGPAPVLSRTPGVPITTMPAIGQHTKQVLRDVGFGEDYINKLVSDGVLKLGSKL